MKMIELKDPLQTIEIAKDTYMPWVLLKGLWLSILRPSIDSSKDIVFNKFSSCRNNKKLDSGKIELFHQICNSSQTAKNSAAAVPMVYLQTLFIGLLGRYIISPYFPLVPMGLIHTKQKISQKRQIHANEILNTKITLSEIKQDSKGFETTFLLELLSAGDVVWEGTSTFLSKDKNYKKEKQAFKNKEALPPFVTMDVPYNIGRQYAKVSGDCNPHHLSAFFAKLFGFKSPIAHGMWSLARSVAEIENQFTDKEVCGIDIAFKRPLFLPGKVTLGAIKDNKDIAFELRDHKTTIPHIAGTIQTR
jgi:MaoC like domain